MDKYHVCFLIGKELCTGTNVIASNYIDAINIFNEKYPNKKIIYVTMLE